MRISTEVTSNGSSSLVKSTVLRSSIFVWPGTLVSPSLNFAMPRPCACRITVAITARMTTTAGNPTSRAARLVGFPAVVVILAVIATVILHAQGLGVAKLSDGLTNVPGQTNIELLSTVLFTKLLLPFEVTSVLILIAILGAVALARHDDTDPQGSTERTGK